LFDIGVGEIVVGNENFLSKAEKTKRAKLRKKRHKEKNTQDEENDVHTEMQYHLLRMGSELGYDVISASNDRSKCHKEKSFSFISLSHFPDIGVYGHTNKTIALIDVVWFQKGTNKIDCAFEVENSTSITSGISRLTDLFHSFPEYPSSLFLIIPDNRENELKLKLSSPTSKATIQGNNIQIHYILYSDLRKHCDAICTLGDSKEILKKIAKVVN